MSERRDSIASSVWTEDEGFTVKPLRKRFPFDLMGRGIAGVEEMSEYLDNSRVYFGLLQIQVGSGSFARAKTIFIHFNGEEANPMQRARENKRLATAQEAFRPYHAELTILNKSECTIENVFSRLGGLFVADSMSKDATKFDLGSLKEDYKKRMTELKKKSGKSKSLAEMKAELREKKKREAEEARAAIEAAKAAAEAEKERIRLEQEAAAEAERQRIAAEEEAERLRIEEEERQAEIERLKIEEEEKKAAEEEAAAAAAAKKAEEEAAAKKKKKRRKGKKKDDWSNDKPWTGERLVKCIHEQTSPFNWGVFAPSHDTIIPIAYGHGSLPQLREELRPDQVIYGIFRLTFGEGRWKRSHWVFFCWSPRSMSDDAPPRERSKKLKERNKGVRCKQDMQRLIGPFGVEIEADDLTEVTLENWILRVRRTVVVDGLDDFMNAESFEKALAAEKAHFEKLEAERLEKKRAQEAENAQTSIFTGDKTPLVTPVSTGSTPAAMEEMSLDSAAPTSEVAADSVAVVVDPPAEPEIAEEEEHDDDEKSAMPPSDDEAMAPQDDPSVPTIETDLVSVTEDAEMEPKKLTKKKKKKKKKWPPGSDDEAGSGGDETPASRRTTPLTTPKAGRRKRLTDEEKEQREIESAMVFESVTLVQNVQTEFTWILVSPRT